MTILSPWLASDPAPHVKVAAPVQQAAGLFGPASASLLTPASRHVAEPGSASLASSGSAHVAEPGSAAPVTSGFTPCAVAGGASRREPASAPVLEPVAGASARARRSRT